MIKSIANIVWLLNQNEEIGCDVIKIVSAYSCGKNYKRSDAFGRFGDQEQ